MTGFRRHSLAAGLVLAWMMALSNLLGGLAFARSLPRAHAEALAAGSLCLPDGGSGPLDHASHHAAGCAICPGNVSGHQTAAAPPQTASVLVARAMPGEAAFAVSSTPAVAALSDGAVNARGPPGQ